MAGTPPSSGFAAEFRDAIHTAMLIGRPPDASEGVFFTFAEDRTWAVQDTADNPYDWTAAPVTDVVTAPLQVPCAVQFSMGDTSASSVGVFDSSKVTLTLLDVDFEQVETASGFVINGVHYEITAVGPPLGLFDAAVYLVHGQARG